jgi:hypothetical protein
MRQLPITAQGETEAIACPAVLSGPPLGADSRSCGHHTARWHLSWRSRQGAGAREASQGVGEVGQVHGDPLQTQGSA